MHVTISFDLNDSEEFSLTQKFRLEPAETALKLLDDGASEADGGAWVDLWQEFEEHGGIDICGEGDDPDSGIINTTIESSDMNDEHARAVVAGYLSWFAARGVIAEEIFEQSSTKGNKR